MVNQIHQKAKINEMALLGACLIHKQYVPIVASEAKEDWFLNSETRKLFVLIKESFQNEEVLRTKIVKSKLASFSAKCYEKAYSTSNEVKSGIKELQSNYSSIKLLALTEKIDYEKPTSEMSRLMSGIQDISHAFEEEEANGEALLELYEEARKEQAEKRKEGKEIIGYRSGIAKIDDIIDGVRKEHFWVVGGYSSMGKTFFALNIVHSLLKQDVKVGIFSLEMSKQDLLGRIFGIETHIPSIKLLKGILTTEENNQYQAAKNLIKDRLTIFSEKSSLDDILTSMQLLRLRDGVEVFVLDYAQLVQDGASNEYETLRKTSMKLQHFCRKNKVSIIMLSQISNESAKNPNSFVMGFKGSGAIAASADLAIELSPNEDKEERERKIVEKEPFKVMCGVKKNRHGPIRDIELLFDTRIGVFKEDVDLDDF